MFFEKLHIEIAAGLQPVLVGLAARARIGQAAGFIRQNRTTLVLRLISSLKRSSMLVDFMCLWCAAVAARSLRSRQCSFPPTRRASGIFVPSAPAIRQVFLRRPNLCGHRATATPAASRPPLLWADVPGHFSGSGHSSVADRLRNHFGNGPLESRVIIRNHKFHTPNPRLFRSRRTSFQLVWLSRLASSTARI